MSMKDFARRGYFTIKFIQKYYPTLGVGVANGHPDVYYLYYKEEWDKRAPDDDLKEFRKFTSKTTRKCGDDIAKIKQTFKEIEP